MSRKSRLFSLMADATASAAVRGASKARSGLRDLLGGGRFTCACCPDRVFRGHKALNAHHLARHGNYWGGKAGKAMQRKVGKVQDAARRAARGAQHANGDLDHRGRLTPKGRTRPEVRGGPREARRALRDAHRHDRDHQRAENREHKAERAAARGRHAKAARLRDKAADLRGRHSDDGGHNMIPRSHPAHPSRAPQPARPPQTAGKTRIAPGSAPARGNGSRPAAGRRTPAPNGTRTIRTPARAGRTRTR